MTAPAVPAVPVKSRSVLGATELTLLAPIKRGLIPALDARSYESRATLVLRTLHALGLSRREIDPTPAIEEVADAIRAIRSFRLAIVGSGSAAPQVLLAVAFDGGWEPYMRRIWRDLGPLLDLIFCNCEGYLLSRSHDYPAYISWVRRVQVETGFYYEGSALTVADWQRLRVEEGRRPPVPGAPPAPPAPPAPAAPDAAAVFAQARAALVGLYRLADMHLPDTEDGDTLLGAARLLLRSVVQTRQLPPAGWLRTPSEEAAWRWFDHVPPQPPQPPQPPAAESADLANVQGGILETRPVLAHGCLALVGFGDEPAAAVALIDHVLPLVQSAGAPPYRNEGPLFANIGFTHAGLASAGIDAGTLAQLPQEFREGMAARAGILGDWQHNHPLHWTLPEAYDGGSGAAAAGATPGPVAGPKAPPVALARVHAVVQFTLTGPATDAWQDFDSAAKQPLRDAVAKLHAALQAAGGAVLAVQPMQRYADGQGRARGHFGFADGLSQPGLAAPGQRLARDTVPPGDLLLGYRNGLGDPPLRGRLWKDGTFAVVRKLRQYPERLRTQVPDREARARLMGRFDDGVNLIDGTPGNDFDYHGDRDGQKCPLWAHARRANPREVRPDLVHLPRLVRRGMSYGPKLAEDNGNVAKERGLVFIAYNASIAEQFEVIQGWLAGGNSTGEGSRSMLRDPFVGVAREGDPRAYTWNDAQGTAHTIDLPAGEPLVELQWGLYAFMPSLKALEDLRTRAAEAAEEAAITDPDQPPAGADREAVQRKRDQRTREATLLAARGSAVIARLQQAEPALGVDGAVLAWKQVLEDLGARMSGTSQAVWAAVRKVHGGVLRTPYGILVASRALVDEVFVNAEGRYSTSGYNTRLAASFGEIYLGRDDEKRAGCPYRAEADPANAAIMAVTAEDAFASAYGHTAQVLQGWLGANHAGAGASEITVDVKDLVDGLLAAFCTEWFGIPDPGGRVRAGGWHFDARASCPGHFHAPSRHTFQPQPGDEARRAGEAHGQALKQAVRAFVGEARQQPAQQGRLGSRLFAAFADDAPGNDRLATTLVGVMMGFLPTVDGNLRSVLYEWVEDRALWTHQAALRAAWPLPAVALSTHATAARVLAAPLARTMQLRPVPELVWRTALKAHVLGAGPQAVQVHAGDIVVAAIVSATQEDLAAERDDPYVVFGGRRTTAQPRVGQPTHACPGFAMAQGVMQGFLAALLDRATLAPALSPLALRLAASMPAAQGSSG